MATREQLIEDFADHKYATGEKFARLINSMKVVQEPVTDPAASGTSLSFISSIEQDADGKISATKKTLDLSNAHELNPFKGWWKTGDILPTSGFDGAYLYFKDTTQTPAVTTIYQWNGTAYADTGTVVDTSNVQTFASGQAVNTVKIKDETGEEVQGSAGVLSAEAGKELAQKVEDGMLCLSISENAGEIYTYIPYTFKNGRTYRFQKRPEYSYSGNLTIYIRIDKNSSSGQAPVLLNANADYVDFTPATDGFKYIIFYNTTPTAGGTEALDVFDTSNLLNRGFEHLQEEVDDLNDSLGEVDVLKSQVEDLSNTIISNSTVELNGTSTSILTLVNPIELSQDGDELEIKVEGIVNPDTDAGLSFSNGGTGSSGYAIQLGRKYYGLRPFSGSWIKQNQVITNSENHTVKVVYADGKIYSYVDGTLVHTNDTQSTVRLSSFGNGGNGGYGYWGGKIVYVKHNGVEIPLYQQIASEDATVNIQYKFVRWSDISGLDILPEGILKYDSTNKIFDFFQRSGKTNKYFSFRVRLNEDNRDIVYLKEWRLSEGKVWSYDGQNFTEIAETIYDAENEMAMHFAGTSDYTGGIHGDERIDVSQDSFVRFYADGRLITAEEMQEDFTIECASFCYMQLSTLHETSTVSGEFVSGHPIIAYHFKRNTFKDCSSELENVIKFASEQSVSEYHAGMMCVGKGAGKYALLPSMVQTPELSGLNSHYNADDFSASRVDMWNPTTGIRCYVDGIMEEGFENTDIQQFQVWDRTTDSKYYRRFVAGLHGAQPKVFSQGNVIRNKQVLKFY